MTDPFIRCIHFSILAYSFKDHDVGGLVPTPKRKSVWEFVVLLPQKSLTHDEWYNYCVLLLVLPFSKAKW